MKRLACFLLCSGLVAIFTAIQAHAMAGDLQQPSLAMPAGTPDMLRTNVLSALSDPACKFLEGRFINANTTLEYGGPASALNRLLSSLSHCEGMEVNLSFTKGEVNGPSWTINHMGWGAATRLDVQVNLAASTLDMSQLAITLTAPPATKAAIPKQ